MAIDCYIYRVPKVDLDRLFAEPHEVEDYLFSGPGRLLPRGLHPRSDFFSLNRDWDAINCVLTNMKRTGMMPLSSLRDAPGIGTELGFQGLSVAEVTSFDAALDLHCGESWMNKLDTERFRDEGVYKYSGADLAVETGLRQRLVHELDKLKSFVKDTAQKEMGLIIWYA